MMRPRVRARMTFGRDTLGSLLGIERGTLAFFGTGRCFLTVASAGCGMGGTGCLRSGGCSGSSLVIGRLGAGGVLRFGFVGGLHLLSR